MRKLLCLFSIAILLITSLCGCSTTTTDVNATDSLDETSISNIGNEANNISEVLTIYEESLKDNIELYCEEYLTYQGTPIDNLDDVKEVLTDEYYNRIKSTENYNTDDKDYEQATALNTLYYEDYSTPSSSVKVLAQCYESVVFENKSNTYNTFYLFDMKYEDGKGWLIDSVEKPSYEYLEE